MWTSRDLHLWNLCTPLLSGASGFDRNLRRTTDLACRQKQFLVLAWSPSHWPALLELRTDVGHGCWTVLSLASAADVLFRIEALESVRHVQMQVGCERRVLKVSAHSACSGFCRLRSSTASK
jgi:hypothetical protein